MFAQFTPALRMLVIMSALTGVVYPLVVTGIAQLAFPRAANGSLILADGKTVGSDLIGQPFDDPKYFWSRPSATSPQPYNGMSSSGSNLGPRNPALADVLLAWALQGAWLEPLDDSASEGLREERLGTMRRKRLRRRT